MRGVRTAAAALMLVGMAAGGAPTAALAAGAPACPAVTHGTLGAVARQPGLIVVADVEGIDQPGTPATDTLAIREIIRQPPNPVFGDLGAGTLTVPSNACWEGLRPGDRVVAVFPYPDGLVAERSVAWRVDRGGGVSQVSHQDVTGVPATAARLIAALRRVASGLPETSTLPPAESRSAIAPQALWPVFALSVLAMLAALPHRSRRC